MKSIFIPIFLFLLAGCDSTILLSNFQLVTSSDGAVYRLNTKTGEVHKVSDNILIKIHESNRIVLSKNIILETENKDTYEYKGNGEFVKRDLSNPEKMAEDWLHEMDL